MYDQITYNTGNYDKYMSRNPLKRKLVKRLNNKILYSINLFMNSIYSKDHKSNKEIKLLDAGCGEGFIDSLILKTFKEIQITGLEYTSEAIEIASNTNPGVRYIQGNIISMPFEDKEFDIVICTEVLEHVVNPEIALNELIRVCSGQILITVPQEPWFCMGNMVSLKNITRFGNPIDHINHWTKKSFARFLKKESLTWVLDNSFPWVLAICTDI